MMTKEEIEQEMKHKQDMLHVLRQNRRIREIQEAKLGINVPPEIINDIHELTGRIQSYEIELSRLQSLAAEDQIPLEQVEYRAVLAEVWGATNGKATVAGITRLELVRLRLGIKPELSRQIEKDIRSSLAREAFYSICKDDFQYIRHYRN